MMDFNIKLPRDGSEQNLNIFKNTPINIVDFGFATKFAKASIGEDGKKKTLHKSMCKVDVFRGNMIFASANQFEFTMTSRRDDLISLCYLLIFLINKGNIPGVNIYNQSKNRND